MTNLTQHQQDAINLGKQYRASRSNSTRDAINCGVALNIIKEALPHGKFTTWFNANMPFKIRQGQKCMKLAKHRPELLSKTYSGTLLDIASEIKLIPIASNKPNVETKIREVANTEDMTQAEISDLIKRLTAPIKIKLSKVNKELTQGEYTFKMHEILLEMRLMGSDDLLNPRPREFQDMVDKFFSIIEDADEILSDAENIRDAVTIIPDEILELEEVA